jgi:hypothetical protein
MVTTVASLKLEGLGMSTGVRLRETSHDLQRPNFIVLEVKKVLVEPAKSGYLEPTNVCGHPYSLQIRTHGGMSASAHWRRAGLVVRRKAEACLGDP